MCAGSLAHFDIICNNCKPQSDQYTLQIMIDLYRTRWQVKQSQYYDMLEEVKQKQY